MLDSSELPLGLSAYRRPSETCLAICCPPAGRPFRELAPREPAGQQGVLARVLGWRSEGHVSMLTPASGCMGGQSEPTRIRERKRSLLPHAGTLHP